MGSETRIISIYFAPPQRLRCAVPVTHYYVSSDMSMSSSTQHYVFEFVSGSVYIFDDDNVNERRRNYA